MIITNKYNLPQQLVDYAKGSQFRPTPKHYSATTIIGPVRDNILTRRHFDEIEEDISDCINRLFGSATHKILEDLDKTGFAEIYFKEEIRDGYYLTGKCDLYNENENSIEDYKTASVWKILKQDFSDWKKQGLIYAWLALKQGKFVDKLRFRALLKDWTAKDKRVANLKGDFYPEAQVYTWEYKITTKDLNDIEEYIRTRFDEYIAAESLADDDLPDCGKVDTWYTGDKYAVYGTNKNKALRVLDSLEEAEDYMKNKGGVEIVYRPGEYRKCQDYCSSCKFCKYYNERKAE